MRSIRLKIPASTSNIGPGFDTLGIALGLYNELVLTSSGRLEIEFERGVEDIFSSQIRRMVKKTIAAFEDATGEEIGGLKLLFKNDIPIARGLGSSATFRMGTLLALNRWLKNPLEEAKLFDIGCELERHTENCVTCLKGGLTASGFINGHVQYGVFELRADLTFVAAIPQRPMSTAETRKILPRRIGFKDAVFNLNRTALLIHALTAGELSRLGPLLEDRLHQHRRAEILTPLFQVIAAARKAGAWGGFLSGSGSTIIAVATQNINRIAEAMKKTLDNQGWPCEVLLLKADRNGIFIKVEE